MGVFPVVHGVRSLSLQAHLEETNTFERLQALINLNVIDERLGKDTAEALSYLMDMRLKTGLQAQALTGTNLETDMHNELDTKALSTLERDLLKDALQVVKRFKNMVRHHFHLGGS